MSKNKGVKIDLTALGPSSDNIAASLPSAPDPNREYVIEIT